MIPFLDRLLVPSFLRYRPSRKMAVLAAMLLTTLLPFGLTRAESVQNGNWNFQVDASAGTYSLQSAQPPMEFQGRVEGSMTDVRSSAGQDRMGAFQDLMFSWEQEGTPVRADVHLYGDKPRVLFVLTFLGPTRQPGKIIFPDFQSLPKDLHVFSYQKTFSHPAFAADNSGTPWLFFNNQKDAAILSPASHFFATDMQGDGRRSAGVSLNSKLAIVPANYSISSVMVALHGINAAWDAWGQALLDQGGKTAPTNESNVGLRYLGYWTDNGCAYYIQCDPHLGYAGTLLAEVQHLRQQSIPVRYLMLDGWWTAGDCAHQYVVNPAYFPDGLAAFQKQVDLPLFGYIAAPCMVALSHNKFPVDNPAASTAPFWNFIADYLKTGDIGMVEVDWLNKLNTQNHFDTAPQRADAFMDGMGQTMAARHIDICYCMALPRELLQASQYPSASMDRVSDDVLSRPRWWDIVYTSRLVYSLGMWPWTDSPPATEADHGDSLLLQTLTAGMVGFGDYTGKEDRRAIMPAVRADGVIVKPDLPLMPTDQTYVDQVQHPDWPVVAHTVTSQGTVSTAYVFAFGAVKDFKGPWTMHNVEKSSYFVPVGNAYDLTKHSQSVRFSPAEMGLSGPVFVYNYFTHEATEVPADGTFSGQLGENQKSYYVCAPTGASGIAFMGDLNQYVGTGQTRIPALSDSPSGLQASVAFAKGENSITLHGFADFKPVVRVEGGQGASVQYDSATHEFSVAIQPGGDLPWTQETDPVRVVKATFSKSE